MPRNDDVPQTVGEALDCGWEWLRVRCVYCRRSARIMLASRHREETIGSVARRARCRHCSDPPNAEANRSELDHLPDAWERFTPAVKWSPKLRRSIAGKEKPRRSRRFSECIGDDDLVNCARPLRRCPSRAASPYTRHRVGRSHVAFEMPHLAKGRDRPHQRL